MARECNQSPKQSRSPKQSPRTISRAETISTNSLQTPINLLEQSPLTIPSAKTISKDNLGARHNLPHQSHAPKQLPQTVITLQTFPRTISITNLARKATSRNTLASENISSKRFRTLIQSPQPISARQAISLNSFHFRDKTISKKNLAADNLTRRNHLPAPCPPAKQCGQTDSTQIPPL